MKTPLTIALALILNLAGTEPCGAAPEGQQLTLSIGLSNNHLQLSWPGIVHQSYGSILRPYFELQRSLDLRSWQPVGQRYRAPESAELLRVLLEPNDPLGFYRLLSVTPPATARRGSGGAEVFGYAEAFARELSRIGQISPDEFAGLFPTGTAYLPGISWNPTNAAYWDGFNADPEMVNAGKEPGAPGYRTIAYRLNEADAAAV